MVPSLRPFHIHGYIMTLQDKQWRLPVLLQYRCRMSGYQGLWILTHSFLSHFMSFSIQVHVFVFKRHMACILLANMDPPITGNQNGLPPNLDSATGPKRDLNATGLSVHRYCERKDGGEGGASYSESVLTFPPGEYVVEELCISAAKACGESQQGFSSHVCPHAQNIVSFIEQFSNPQLKKNIYMYIFVQRNL